jgi:hypothetical protein
MMAGGIVTPSAFAVFRLTTSSTLVGCSTGMSPGLALVYLGSATSEHVEHISAIPEESAGFVKTRHL